MERKESTESVESDDGSLPISIFKKEIIQLVSDNLFCIITGETGSGKSTQIAQFMVDGIGKPFNRIDDNTFE